MNFLQTRPRSAGRNKFYLPSELHSEIIALKTKNNWYNFFAIAWDWLLIGSSAYLSHCYPQPIFYLMAIVIIGGRMRGLDNIIHEASHGILFKNPTLNKYMACFFAAFPIFTSYTAYSLSHRNHHKYLWNYEKDPDTKRYALFGLDAPPSDFKTFALRHLLKPMTLIHVPRYFLGTLHVNLFSRNEPARETLFKAIFWASILLICSHFGVLRELVLYWFVPFLTTFQVIRYWVEMAEHAGLRSNNPLESSRNSFGNIAERFLLQPHHDCYHLAHHLLPGIPHFNLSKAHLILMKHRPYMNAHHCLGFFNSLIPGFKTVIDDVRGLNFVRETRFL